MVQGPGRPNVPLNPGNNCATYNVNTPLHHCSPICLPLVSESFLHQCIACDASHIASSIFTMDCINILYMLWERELIRLRRRTLEGNAEHMCPRYVFFRGRRFAQIKTSLIRYQTTNVDIHTYISCLKQEVIVSTFPVGRTPAHKDGTLGPPSHGKLQQHSTSASQGSLGTGGHNF